MDAHKNNEVAINELILALGLLLRRIRSMAPAGLRDLSWTQKSVIVRLDNDGPATIAELARAEGVKPQSMGTAVAELESLGLIERKAHESDRRQVNIKITAKGKSIRSQAKEAKHVWLAQAVAKLDKREQARVFQATKIIERLAEM